MFYELSIGGERHILVKRKSGMAAMIEIIIDLDQTNTRVDTNPEPYNVQVIVDLSGIWSSITEEISDEDKIQVYTRLRIPVIQNGLPAFVQLTLASSFMLNSIENKKVTQNGYFEGVYDASRRTQTQAGVWKYTLISGGVSI